MIKPIIHDRGRGPEIEGTRISKRGKGIKGERYYVIGAGRRSEIGPLAVSSI